MEKITLYATRDIDGICLYDHEPVWADGFFCNDDGLYEPLHEQSQLLAPMFSDIMLGEVRKVTITIEDAR